MGPGSSAGTTPMCAFPSVKTIGIQVRGDSTLPNHALAGRGRLPIDRYDVVAHLPIKVVGVLPHGADRRFSCAGGALDAVVTATGAVENLMKGTFHRLHRRGREEGSGR